MDWKLIIGSELIVHEKHNKWYVYQSGIEKNVTNSKMYFVYLR